MSYETQGPPRGPESEYLTAEQLNKSLSEAAMGWDPELSGTVSLLTRAGIDIISRERQQAAYEKNPEYLDLHVQKQEELYRNIINPYIGRLVAAETTSLVIEDKKEGIWRQVVSPKDYPFSVKGIIDGLESQLTEISEGRWLYRIGIGLKLPDPYVISIPEGSINGGESQSLVSRAIVPLGQPSPGVALRNNKLPDSIRA